MTLQETEIEIKYIQVIADRLEKEGESIYTGSPKDVSNMYAHITNNYSYEEEQRLEQEAIEWEKSEECIRYMEIVKTLGGLYIVLSGLETEQINHVINKYNIEV